MKSIEEQTYSDLVKSKREIEQELERRRVEGLARLILTIKSQVKDSGFTIQEVARELVKVKHSQSEALYIHPKNPLLTWTGKGRKPRWIQEALAKGSKLEDFRIRP